MTMTTVTDKGAVTIPAEVRERRGLRPGTRVHVVDYGEMVAIVPSSPDPVAASHGMLRGPSTLTAAFLAARREGEAPEGEAPEGEEVEHGNDRKGSRSGKR